MADLQAIDKQPTLIHPDIILEIPGVKTADIYDRIIGPILIGKKEKPSSYLSALLKRVKM